MALKRAGQLKRSAKLQPRKRMRQMSEQRRKKLAAKGIVNPGSTLLSQKALKAKFSTIGPDQATADAVVDREQHSCVVCGKWLEPNGRGSSWSIHHRRRVRTDNRMCNLVAVCGGADVPGCHQEIHANVSQAEEAGWLVKKAFNPADKVMAHSQFGWVRLHDDATFTRAPEQEADCDHS